jgi:hypothetical protein
MLTPDDEEGAYDGYARLVRTANPEHLLHKLEWEYAQWQEDPLNTYRAWNFFATAEHLPDWLARTGPRALGGFRISAFRRSTPLLRICSHLASGARHFRPGPEHTSVASTHRREGWIEPRWISEDWNTRR